MFLLLLVSEHQGEKMVMDWMSIVSLQCRSFAAGRVCDDRARYGNAIICASMIFLIPKLI